MASVNLDFRSFRNNIELIKSVIHPQVLSIGLKDNAYGHGIHEIEEKCFELNVLECFVRNFREAASLQISKWNNILVLAPYPRDSLSKEFLSESVIYTLSDFSELSYFDARYRFEVEINIGMNRNGFDPQDVPILIERLKKLGLTPFGVYTHLHVSVENERYAYRAIKRAEKIFELFQAEFPSVRRHFANTDTALSLNEVQADLCRVGIGCYGYASCTSMNEQLMPVMELIGHRQKRRFCSSGDHVGYGYRTYIVESDNYEVSLYDVGYADFRCRFNERKPFNVASGGLVCGRVSMDSMAVACGLPEISIFKDVETISKYFETIPYEILVSVNAHISRKWVNEYKIE